MDKNFLTKLIVNRDKSYYIYIKSDNVEPIISEGNYEGVMQMPSFLNFDKSFPRKDDKGKKSKKIKKRQLQNIIIVRTAWACLGGPLTAFTCYEKYGYEDGQLVLVERLYN